MDRNIALDLTSYIAGGEGDDEGEDDDCCDCQKDEDCTKPGTPCCKGNVGSEVN